MEILFTSDTHVHPGHLRRLFEAAESLAPGAVIIGGDLIPAWKGGIAASIQPHRLWIQDKLLPTVAAFHDAHPSVPLFLDLGNDDIEAARPLLEERDGIAFRLLHMRMTKINDTLAIVGYMAVNPTPFALKDREKPDCPDQDGLFAGGAVRTGYRTRTGIAVPHVLSLSDGSIEEDLDALSRAMEEDCWKDCSFLFVSHCPPRETALDRTSTGLNVGSLAVRRFIERWAPTGRLLAGLHGHIHESPWQSGLAWQAISGTPCFNAGQYGKALRAIVLDSVDPAASARLVEVDTSSGIRVFPKDEWLG